jgi:hypothetical protein
MRVGLAAAGACCAIACAAAVAGQGSAPLRALHAGSITAFRVALRVRSEVEGQKTTTIGAKTYVQPVSQWVEQRIAWVAEQSVITVSGDGTAEVEEKLEGFSSSTTSSNDDAEARKLLDAMRVAEQSWEVSRTLRYRESPSGQITGVGAEGAPPLDEAGPRLLTAWLLRALRPTAALPAHPLVANKPWQEQRSVQFPEWANTAGSETGAWLGDSSGLRVKGEPALQLHSTQEISGTVIGGSEKPREGSARARFHAESLSTLALSDLRLLAASRSVLREIIWTLAPVEGLPTPPQFRGRLLAEVRIQVCDETPCSNPAGAASGDHR